MARSVVGETLLRGIAGRVAKTSNMSKRSLGLRAPIALSTLDVGLGRNVRELDNGSNAFLAGWMVVRRRIRRK